MLGVNKFVYIRIKSKTLIMPNYEKVFVWYTEWLLSHPNKEELIFGLLDNLNQKSLDNIVSTYKQLA
jgi:hypothetical protein